MNIYNQQLKLIFCHICNQPVEYGIKTYNYGDEVRCLDDYDDGDKGALLGYDWDIPNEWRNKTKHEDMYFEMFGIEEDE